MLVGVAAVDQHRPGAAAELDAVAVAQAPEAHGHRVAAERRVLARGGLFFASTELALEDAGLAGSALLGSGAVGISYGSSSGTPDAMPAICSGVWWRPV